MLLSDSVLSLLPSTSTLGLAILDIDILPHNTVYEYEFNSFVPFFKLFVAWIVLIISNKNIDNYITDTPNQLFVQLKPPNSGQKRSASFNRCQIFVLISFSESWNISETCVNTMFLLFMVPLMVFINL